MNFIPKYIYERSQSSFILLAEIFLSLNTFVWCSYAVYNYYSSKGNNLFEHVLIGFALWSISLIIGLLIIFAVYKISNKRDSNLNLQIHQ